MESISIIKGATSVKKEAAKVQRQKSFFFAQIPHAFIQCIGKMLQRPNPSASDGCGKEECTMCSQPGGGKMCHKLNAVYKYECNLDGYSYIGETSRNFFSRNQEHEENYLNKRPESFINNHQAEMHGGQDPDFKYSVLKTFKDPLSRQICEGVQIRRLSGGVLNSKLEQDGAASESSSSRLGIVRIFSFS